jgi:hypothetical protein
LSSFERMWIAILNKICNISELKKMVILVVEMLNNICEIFFDYLLLLETYSLMNFIFNWIQSKHKWNLPLNSFKLNFIVFRILFFFLLINPYFKLNISERKDFHHVYLSKDPIKFSIIIDSFHWNQSKKREIVLMK